jgi:hypothetical protein
MFRRIAQFSLVGLFAASVLALAASPIAGANGHSEPALTAARFSITVDGVNLGSWSKVDGLDVSWSRGTVVLSRKTIAATSASRRASMEMFAWHEAAMAGRLGAVRDAVIVAYGANGDPVARYHIENAWPSKVELGITSRGVPASHETVTLVCEDIQRVSP